MAIRAPRISQAAATAPPPAPPKLPPPSSPHVYVEKGLGSGKTEKR